MVRLFADTYALIELLKGNPNYEKYSRAYLIATEFDIFELTYAVFRDYGRNEAAKVVILMRDKIEILPTEDSDYLDAPFASSPPGLLFGPPAPHRSFLPQTATRPRPSRAGRHGSAPAGAYTISRSFP